VTAVYDVNVTTARHVCKGPGRAEDRRSRARSVLPAQTDLRLHGTPIPGDHPSREGIPGPRVRAVGRAEGSDIPGALTVMRRLRALPLTTPHRTGHDHHAEEEGDDLSIPRTIGPRVSTVFVHAVPTAGFGPPGKAVR
jgi:hypothetical protein